MWLTDVSIRRPLTILMAILALIVLGYQSMSRMPVDLYPEVDIPYVSVITIYPGAGPQELETLVSKPIEESVASINKVKNVTASSQESISIVVVEFQVGADLDVAASDIRDHLDRTKSKLPKDAEDPIIYKLDIAAMPVMYLGVSGKRPLAEVKKMADDVLKDRFGKVDGVAAVSVTGGEEREIYVKVDQERLKANGLNIMEITQAIAQANLNIPAGSIKQGRREYTVRIVGEFINPQELQDLKIRGMNPMNPLVVELKDIATVLDSVAEREQFTRLDGVNSVGIVIQKQANANTVQVTDGVRREMEALKKELPQDIKISVSLDNSVFIKQSLHDVTSHLIEGALLATLVVFAFLHIFRATFIILLAIPTSIMATFLPIYFFGFSVNMITLMGLALCVGILVDDSIVVLENIFRHLMLGEKPREAALNGRMEIGGAAVAITFTDVVVFVPIAFMGGIVGQFFRQFGVTVATATLFSLVMSFTLTPMLASRWMRAEDVTAAEGGGRGGFWAGFFKRFNAGFSAITSRYRSSLKWSLRHRWLVIIGGNMILILSVLLVRFMGFEFMPQVDSGQLLVTLEMPVGTNVDETSRVTTLVESYILNREKYPEVESVFTNIGSVESFISAGEQGPQYAQITIKLVDKNKRKRSVWKIEESLTKELAGVPGPVVRMSAAEQRGGGQEPPIYVELTGADTDALVRLAQEVRRAVEATEGTKDIDVTWKLGRPELQVQVDRLRAAQYGLSVAQIAMTLRNSIEGNSDSKYRELGKEYDIRIRLGKGNRRSKEDIENVMLASAMGKNIILKDVAEVSLTEGPTKLERKNRQRLIVVQANLAPGFALGNVTKEIEKRLAS
ncbi:MAG: efflux RND transporter permease subunit, partial [bacterium]